MNSFARNVSRMQRLDRWLGIPLCAALTLARKINDGLFGARSRQSRRGILFLKLAEQGSTVLATDAITEAIRLAGTEHVYFLVFAENRAILDILGWVPRDNIYAIDTSSAWRLCGSSWGQARALRKLRLALCIDLEFFARATAILAYLIGCPRRVGFAAFPGAAPYRGNLLTDRVLYNPHLHTSAAFASLVLATTVASELPALPLTGPRPALLPPPFQAGAEERDAVADLLRQRGVDGGPLILINANAGDLLPLRRWAEGNYIDLPGRLLEVLPEAYIIFTGNRTEKFAGENLAAAVGSPRACSLAGETTLRQLLVLYNRSEILVTNDSGPAHFAALTSIDCVALFGPETPDLFAAPGPRSHPISARLACSPCVNVFNNRQTKCRNNICMQAITVEEVLARVLAIYNRRRELDRDPVCR